MKLILQVLALVVLAAAVGVSKSPPSPIQAYVMGCMLGLMTGMEIVTFLDRLAAKRRA